MSLTFCHGGAPGEWTRDGFLLEVGSAQFGGPLSRRDSRVGVSSLMSVLILFCIWADSVGGTCHGFVMQVWTGRPICRRVLVLGLEAAGACNSQLSSTLCFIFRTSVNSQLDKCGCFKHVLWIVGAFYIALTLPAHLLFHLTPQVPRSVGCWSGVSPHTMQRARLAVVGAGLGVHECRFVVALLGTSWAFIADVARPE